MKNKILSLFLAAIVFSLITSSCSRHTPVTPMPAATPITYTYFDADNSNIAYYGRWDFTDPKNPAADWGPVYIKVNFQGPGISVKFNDPNNNFQYSIDNGNFKTVAGNAALEYDLAEGLADTTHQLLFVRRSECDFGTTIFQGVGLAQGMQLLPVSQPPSHRIEFIGDSISCGYGDEDTAGAGNTRSDENGYMAFGPQTARLFGADWHVIAESGIGVVKNDGETVIGTELHIQDLYVRTVSSETISWNFSSWVPDAVVVEAGANDFIDGAPFPTQAQFEAAYGSLLDFIRSKYPNAYIFCLSYYPDNNCPQYISDAVSARSADTKIIFVDAVSTPWLLPLPGNYISDGVHPTVAGQTIVAGELHNFMENYLHW